MPLIDEEGNLLGRWNVVDVGAVLVVALFAVGSIWVVTGQPGGLGGESGDRLTVVVESVERSYVSDALADVGACDRGATVEHVQIVDRLTRENRSVDVERIRVRSRLAATREGGGWTYDDQDVYVGGKIQLDYCTVRLEGTVVEIEERSSPRVVKRETTNGTIDLGELPCDPEGGVCVCFELDDQLRERGSSESCTGGEDRGV